MLFQNLDYKTVSMKKITIPAILLIFFLACVEKGKVPSLEGNWIGVLEVIDGYILPFSFEVSGLISSIRYFKQS